MYREFYMKNEITGAIIRVIAENVEAAKNAACKAKGGEEWAEIMTGGNYGSSFS